MIKIEIVERKTNKVMETKEVSSISTFSFYWDRQCDTKNYFWREVKSASKKKA